jgi:hypothetical protein
MLGTLYLFKWAQCVVSKKSELKVQNNNIDKNGGGGDDHHHQ